MFKSKLYLTTFISAVFAVSACSSGGSNTPPPPPPPADTTAPTVSFNPTTLSVESEMTGNSTLEASDNEGVTTGPTVTCTNGGSFDVASNTFTAAAVTADTESICTATASDAAGNEGTATLTVTMTPPPDTTAPVITITPASLSVIGGRTGTFTVDATDSVDGAITPTVTCDNGGVYDSATGVFTAPVVTTQTTITCTVSATDSAGNGGAQDVVITVDPNTPPAVTVSSLELVHEGQPFTLSASATDAEGDTLSYSWSQTAGTAVTIADPTATSLDLTAPVVSADETLTFVLTVSDGQDSTSETIDIIVENLAAAVTTLPPSANPFHAGVLPVSDLYGLIPTDDGGYQLSWNASEVVNGQRAVSSQTYTSLGVIDGGQVDGAFDSFSSVPEFSLPVAVILSGDTDYTLSITLDLPGSADPLTDGVLAHRGAVSGVIGYGDPVDIGNQSSLNDGDTAPIGVDQLVTVLVGDGEPGQIFGLPGSGLYGVTSVITNPDGTSTSFVIVPADTTERGGGDVVVFADNSYGVIYEERAGGQFTLLMQRVALDGTLIGTPIQINDTTGSFNGERTGSFFGPISGSTLTGGDAFVIWEDGGEADVSGLTGRIVTADGSFGSAEFSVEDNGSCDVINAEVSPLNTDQAFVTWFCRSAGMVTELRGKAFNSDGTDASNEILIHSFSLIDATQIPEIYSTVLSDNRVVLAWTYNTLDVTLNTFTTEVLGLYPVGR